MLALFMCAMAYQNLAYHAQLGKSFSEKLAKRTAEFALKIALARLQESAGPDGAISAKRSNIYGDNFLNGNDIGIWHASKNDDKYAIKFSRWLTADYDAGSLGKAAEKPDSQMRIAADKFHWKFSIQDESQKIDLSLQDDTRDDYVQLLCPQCSGDKRVAAIFSPKNQSEMVRGNIDFLEQFSLLDGTVGEGIAQHSDSYTLHSHGVPSSLNGLKTDLSTWLLETDFPANAYVFEGKASLPAPPPTWKFLQSFFRLKNQISGKEIPVRPTYPLYRPQYLVDYSQRTLHNLGDDLGASVQHGIYPIVTQLSFSISAAIIDDKLAIKICPKYSLWNPHNISLQQADYQLNALIAARNNDSKICLTIKGTARQPNVPEKILTLPLCAEEIERHLRPIFVLNFRDSFKAGEVKIFSLPLDTELSPTDRAISAAGDCDNCLQIKTDMLASDYSSFTISCTDQNGSQARNWQEFYIRLTHRPTQEILQEIAQLTPANANQNLTFTFQPAENEKLLLTLSAAMKIGTIEGAQAMTGIRWLAFANPRAPYANRTAFQDPSSIFFGQGNIAANWSWQTIFTDSKASFDQQLLRYLDGLVLFDVPSRDHGVLSVATLRHVNWAPLGYLPSTCLGNSSPNPYIPTNYTTFQNVPQGIWPSHCKVESLFDYAYLLNETFFNNFFCSTLNRANNKLVNRRFKILDTEIKPETLLIKGSFNVHSTCEEAWEAYLSSRTNNRGDIIFPRIYRANANQCATFSRYDVRILAKNIATLVKRQALFPTLSAFINRRLSADGATCGLLQQAIFDSNINRGTCKHYISFSKNKAWFNDGAASGYLEEGLENVLSQADVLQALAHFITVRGDTFKIAAKGSWGNHARCCEVVVQRMPTFANAGENDPTSVNLSEVNKKLGRRFNIILFRWL